MRQPELLAPNPRPPIVAVPPAGLALCRCHGGNKDCCFCGGRGYTKR